MKKLLSFIVVLALTAAAFAADKPAAAKGKLTSIQGIGEATEKKLTDAGVTSVDDLLEKGATPKGREELATKSGLGAAHFPDDHL